MATRERPADRGARTARRLLANIGREIRGARIAAGLSQELVGVSVGVDHSMVGRVERGERPGVSMDVLARICSAVGLDLVIRAYPGGDPVLDAGQLRLLQRLHHRLPLYTRWRTEVPLALPGDQRAWDAVIGQPGNETAVEAETRLADIQALERRTALKKRDGGIGRVILLIADTKSNRQALVAGRSALRGALPLDTREVMPHLSAGFQPPADGIVVL